MKTVLVDFDTICLGGKIKNKVQKPYNSDPIQYRGNEPKLGCSIALT